MQKPFLFGTFLNIATQLQNCCADGKIKLLGLRYGLLLGQAGAAHYGLIRVLWPDKRTIAGLHEQSSCITNAGPPLPPPPIVILPRPPLPSPPDAPIPDLGTLPSAPDKSKSRARRAIDRLAPRCLDTVFHTCWSAPPGDGPVNVSETDREFAKDLEVGDFYLKGKNYRAAELRFRAALNYKPDHPEATFKLAESLDKLRKNDEARDMYQTYLKIVPNGPFAEQARNALLRLEKQPGRKIN